MSFKRTLAVLFVVLASASAFVPSQNSNSNKPATPTPVSQLRTADLSNNAASGRLSATALHERQWNFNRGRGPFGMKRNAEIWNGRAAQMGFTFVLLQELITGKGVVQGLQEGNAFNMACLGIGVFGIIGLTGFLALKGKESDITY
uniref:Uncharacterized protein n=1 Tax=Minutocellus polymorphus TaxID=265543 RepID=A0A6U0IIL6_9STRA|mmetsp:Transcript_11766/g.19585  ORF Transcript_11766/g.19585 Transcript_11766/m.19585 type:complete len:146 (+) Transcript_11766:70-507(+)|eukprot:CAMPEP_0197716392 /NCGR_PEP_ID=MMETSP1434-20131217/1295_1 /TAXON_ID=265543 /ORGANISM="Minutocellus polymorphus, Strain CCMP3303" /LENGTH=145 /DNA_ID=CAMNT_0043300745 /DNA_START=76 /DNA_END=513 /DNA_ORIENTATION=+